MSWPLPREHAKDWDLGANSLAALITRGLAEMTRLIVALGGNV